MNGDRYLPLKENQRKFNVLRVSFGYDLGGHNWYNGKTERRGYYLYVTPCERKEKSLPDGRTYATYTEELGCGAKLLLKEVSRQSKKAEEAATCIAGDKEPELVTYLCNHYGLQLA